MAAVLGLSTYRWNNNLKSILLLAAFPFLLLLLLSALVYVYARGFLTDYAGAVRPELFRSHGFDSTVSTYGPLDFTLSAIYAYWPFVVGAAAVWLLLAYAFNDVLIHAATGAKPVDRAEAPKLYNLLETLCISRGMAVPTIYIIDTDAMNAYASGIDKRTYSITVTRALLDRLDDPELEAVLAHELTHILDRDVRLLLVTIVFVGAISFLAQEREVRGQLAHHPPVMRDCLRTGAVHLFGLRPTHGGDWLRRQRAVGCGTCQVLRGSD